MANDIPQDQNHCGKSKFENRSDWDDSLATIESILNPSGAAFAGLSSSQKAGLERVQNMLLRPEHKKDEEHIPRELLSSEDDSNNEVRNYLLCSFGGVAKQKRSLRKIVKRTMMANAFIKTLSNKTKVKDIPTVVPDEFLSMELEKQQQISNCLTWEKLSRWDFNIFELNEITSGQPLLFVSWALLCSPYSQQAMAKLCGQATEGIVEGYKFMDYFDFSQGKMVSFLRFIEKGYQSENTYHNNIHAADVVQSLHVLLELRRPHLTSPVKTFPLLLAAICHDFKHPGVSNDFQVNSRSELAITYNDTSVLENMHAAKAFEKLLGEAQDPEMDIFSGMNKAQVKAIRHTMVQGILHTDMTKHFVSVNTMKAMALRHERDEIKELDDAEETSLLLFLLHAADISNPAKPRAMSVNWTDRCLEEFFRQGDLEKEKGLPVSPLCDRDTTSRPQSQVGFIKFVVLPTFQIIADFLPKSKDTILPLITENLACWEKLVDQN